VAPRPDTRRAEAFSDSIFAIVITLLVLDLRPPDVPPGQLLYGLLQEWPTYLAYLTSYLYGAVIWTNHKSAFRRIQVVDRGLHWTNFGILFTAALLPFCTAVLARAVKAGNATDERVAVALYSLVGAVMCASWLTFFHYLAIHPDLLAKGVDEGYFARERHRALAGIVLYTAAALIGYRTKPEVALLFFLLIPAFYGVTSEGLQDFAERHKS
jgi:uncharacterized membrane protein